jgi:hypothetical protein
LKRTYTQWKALNIKASGLERDPITGSIEASDDWWEEQNKVTIIAFFCYGMSYSIFYELFFYSGYVRLHNV